MKAKKTEIVGVRLDPDRKEILDKMADGIGCPSSALAYKAVEVWLDVCAKAGCYIPPKYSSDPGISPELLAEIISELNVSRENRLLAADPPGDQYTTKKKGKK